MAGTGFSKVTGQLLPRLSVNVMEVMLAFLSPVLVIVNENGVIPPGIVGSILSGVALRTTPLITSKLSEPLGTETGHDPPV
jgi:hypothetical protein